MKSFFFCSNGINRFSALAARIMRSNEKWVYLLKKLIFFVSFLFCFFFFTPITNSWLEMRHLICFLCKNSPFHSQLISSSSSLHSIASILTFIQSHRKALPPSSLLLPPLHPFPLPSVIPLLPFFISLLSPSEDAAWTILPFLPSNARVCRANKQSADVMVEPRQKTEGDFNAMVRRRCVNTSEEW